MAALFRWSAFCFCVFVFASEGDWSQLTSLPSDNVHPGVAVVGEELFLYGANPLSSAVYKYSMNQDVWAAVSSLPSDRYAMASASVDGDVFSFGGRTATTTLADGLKYTVSADVWVATTNMPTARYLAAVASAGSKVYVVSGAVSPTYTAVSEVYDVPSDAWQSFANFPIQSSASSSAADSVAMYVCGGHNFATGGPINSVYQYHFATSQWSQRTPMPTTRTQAAGAMIGSKLWVCGGSPLMSTVEVYSSDTDTWASANSLPAPTMVASARAASYSNGVGPTYIFMAGGNNGSPFRLFRRLEGPPVLASSFQGDPLITTFSGQAGHVDLFPGVFNLFSSPTVLVNALVVDLPGLPASEDMVMIGVAMYAVTHSNNTHAVYCNTTACESSFRLTGGDGGVSFAFDGLSFQVVFEDVHVIDELGTVAPSDASFLNLHIHVVGALSPHVGGLLADAERLGFDVVRSRLEESYYNTHRVSAVCSPSLVDGPLRRLRC